MSFLLLVIVLFQLYNISVVQSVDSATLCGHKRYEIYLGIKVALEYKSQDQLNYCEILKIDWKLQNAKKMLNKIKGGVDTCLELLHSTVQTQNNFVNSVSDQNPSGPNVLLHQLTPPPPFLPPVHSHLVLLKSPFIFLLPLHQSLSLAPMVVNWPLQGRSHVQSP